MNAIQDVIRRVGQMPLPLSTVQHILDNKICADILFEQNFLDPHCLKLAFSKALGYVMTLGACVSKFPMVLKIISRGGADGLNPFAVYLETCHYFFVCAYNYLHGNPISTYGDQLSSVFQEIVIISLMWLWGFGGKRLSFTHIFTACLCGAIMCKGVLMVPHEHQHLIGKMGILIIIISRIPQIYTNYVNGSVGVQSSITCATGVLGAVGKIYITMVETQDSTILLGAVISFVLNFVLFLQVFLARPTRQVTVDDEGHRAPAPRQPASPALKEKKENEAVHGKEVTIDLDKSDEQFFSTDRVGKSSSCPKWRRRGRKANKNKHGNKSKEDEDWDWVQGAATAVTDEPADTDMSTVQAPAPESSPK